MTLTDPELERYARHIVLPQVGGVGQTKLKAARVAVVGAGGIGSAVIPALAGAGVGRLTIIDADIVDLANLHRQTIYREQDEGMGKAECAAAFARALNSFVEAVPVPERLTSGNAQALLAGHDLIIDGSDNFATRLAVGDACVALRNPLVTAAAIQFQAQVGLFEARPCYRCFVGSAFDSDDCDNCAELGVLGALSATAGSFAALMAINRIAGAGPVEPGQLHLFDGEKLSWRTIRIPADPACPTCT
ncbi:MAG: HesA/MoeB/ThiF family protein [Sphingomicrobium sp.]